MGAVYEAFRDDDAFTKRVAIKMVPAARVTEQVLRRFHHERQILARLEHKNIAALLDGGVYRRRPSLVCDGVRRGRANRPLL